MPKLKTGKFKNEPGSVLILNMDSPVQWDTKLRGTLVRGRRVSKEYKDQTDQNSVVMYLYEHSTCRYVRSNSLHILYVHGPCFNAPYVLTHYITFGQFNEISNFEMLLERPNFLCSISFVSGL